MTLPPPPQVTPSSANVPTALASSSALVSPPMVQDPGLNPFGEFLPRSAPSLWRGSRPPRARLWSWPPVLGLVPAPGPLLEAVSAHVRRNPRRLVQGVLPTFSSIPSPPCNLGDDAGGEPCGGSECRLPHQVFCLQTESIQTILPSTNTLFSLLFVSTNICIFGSRL